MRSILSFAVLAVCLTAATAGDNWTEFRGPQGTGLADGDPPIHFSETENVRWKTPVTGKAWSSPVVWGNQVWVTNAPEDGKKLWVVALDRRTGKVLHDVEVFDNPKPAFCIKTNSYASSTPAIEEGRVYVHFGSAGTACLDTATAKILWERRDLPCDHFRGPASSPILYRDRLFIQFDGADFQYVVALDKQTGRTLWKKDRSFDYGKTIGDMKKAYGTPVVFDIGGKPQLVTPAAFGTIALDPESGQEIWKVVHGGMNVAARPLYSDGRLYLCTGDGGWKFYAFAARCAGPPESRRAPAPAWTQPRSKSRAPLGEHLRESPSLLLEASHLLRFHQRDSESHKVREGCRCSATCSKRREQPCRHKGM